MEALRRGLRELGYVEGRNITIEFRWADGHNERLPQLAADMASAKVDVIVTNATEPALAAKRSTSTIPIVFATVGDAVATGVVASLAHPGGNATGSTFFSPELMVKRLEIAKQAMPQIATVGILVNPDTPLNVPMLQALEVAARRENVSVRPFAARSSEDLVDAFAEIRKLRADVVIVHDHPRLIVNRKAIAGIAAKQLLPTIGYGEFAEAGRLIGYGVNFERAAAFVDKVLRGARPQDLPVEQSTKFEFVINLETARSLGCRDTTIRSHPGRPPARMNAPRSAARERNERAAKPIGSSLGKVAA